MEAIECVLCGGAGDGAVIEENGFQGIRCEKCGIIFVTPRPSLDDVMSLYSSDSAHVSSAQQVRPSTVGDRLHDRLTLRLLRRYRTSGRLVEIGAGGGHFAANARAAGYDVSAVEANPILCSYLSSVGIPSSRTLETDSDILYSCDVLSHFHDPLSEMRRMHSHLKEGGLLVLETGNFGDVQQRYLRRIPTFQYPDHLFFFGERALRELLRRSGFRVLYMRRYSLLPSLWVFRMKERIASASATSGSAELQGSSSISTSPRSSAVTWKRQAFSIALYYLRHGLGRLLPKRGRPQTIIVVAERVA